MPLQDSEFSQYCAKKAFEVSYALFRIAEQAGHRGFAGYIEDQALKLLKSATTDDFAGSSQAIGTIGYFMRLGVEIGAINPATAELIVSETKGLNSAIAELENSAKMRLQNQENIKGIFSRKRFDGVRRKRDSGEEERKNEEKLPVKTEEIVPQEQEIKGEMERNIEQSQDSEIRQSAILQKVRQSGNCRFKDIQEIFPDLSERTIRYDLENLVERGIIDRVGNSGPSIYYRAREDARNLSPDSSL